MGCLTTDCTGVPVARGVCKTCYARLCKQVRRGTANWGDLITTGKCKRGRKYRGLTFASRQQVALATYEHRRSIERALTS